MIVVITGGLGATLAAVAHVEASLHLFHWELLAFVVLIGVPIAFLIHLTVVRAAFLPMRSLLRAIESVQAGETGVRAPKEIIGDPDTDRMIDAFNRMLDDLEASRLRLEELARESLKAQERERQRIARDLHDETAQALASLVVRLKELAAVQATPQAQAQVAELRDLTRRSLEDLRRITLELRPRLLDDLGLVAALEWYTNDLAARSSLEVSFRANGLSQRLPPDLEVALFRVVQEALINVDRHAQASRVEVVLERRDDHVLASVEDDGRGFDLAAVRALPGGGLGLFGMEERVTLVGGKLTIDSQPGKGARVWAEVPINSPVEEHGRQDSPAGS
jgi:two-component system sensor histidine kinase UhpB